MIINYTAAIKALAISIYTDPTAICGHRRFLRGFDAKVIKFIRNRNQVVAVLNEQKQAIIKQAVTRGFNSDVRLKPSGIDWLGDIPEHWEIARLNRFFTLQRGFDITKEQQREGKIPVVSSGGILSFHDCPTSEGPGVLIGRKGTAGSVHYIDGDYWAHDTTLWVNNFNGNWPRYVYYFLLNMDLKRFDTGSANPTINRNLIHPEMIAFPQREEQIHIALIANKKLLKNESLIRQAKREIELVREYRTRLISDVVTGKLDVRHIIYDIYGDLAEHVDLDDDMHYEKLIDDKAPGLKEGAHE